MNDWAWAKTQAITPTQKIAARLRDIPKEEEDRAVWMDGRGRGFLLLVEMGFRIVIGRQSDKSKNVGFALLIISYVEIKKITTLLCGTEGVPT